MKTPITLLLLLLTTNYAFAENIKSKADIKEYDVEIIIFEDAHARYLSSQTWDEVQTNTDTDDESNYKNKPAINNAATFTSITPSILKEKYERMLVSSEYNILFYGAWRQVGLDKTNAFEIDIKELKNHHTNKSKNTLSGTFKLVLARYLHIYNNLEYKRESVTDSDKNLKIHPLTSHRRMRSKELHYIDHPLVGELIQINPVK